MSELPSKKDMSVKPFGKTLLIKRYGSNSSIILVALNNPRKKNTFSDQQYMDLIDMLHSVENNDSIDAVVITGTGDYFTSGADIGSFFALADYIEEHEERGVILQTNSPKFMMTVINFSKMLVTAVNGPAVGIGVTLLPHCDMVYATEDSSYWTPFSRIAIVPEFSSSITFVENMGVMRANQMLCMGEKINANQALECKLLTGIMEGCDKSGDPFVDESIGVKVCKKINDQLLSLPHGGKTARVS